MIRTQLINPTDRKFYLARWVDPITGKTRYRSTGTTVRREAERFALRLENELNSSDFRDALKTTWTEFRERYETEIGPTKAPRTLAKTRTMFDAFEELVGARFLSILDGRLVSTFAAKLRARGIRPYTVRGYLAELRKTLRWAHRLGMIATVPAFEMPRAASKMKGRPITGEEFERFLAKIPEEITVAEWVPEWERLCRLLWLSGLRLEEALRLHWTDPDQITPDAAGGFLRIPAAAQKSRRYQLHPLPPDFWQELDQAPSREGWIVNPWTVPRGGGPGRHRPTAAHVGKVLSAIGEAAGIRVSEDKFASAHDFRRSFAARWARVLTPQTLRELMRHSSVTTTEQFYVGSMAEAAAAELKRVSGHSFGHSAPPRGPAPSPEETAETGKQVVS